MATLEKIRSKGSLLVAIFIGFALFAFIMMDFMGSGGALFSGDNTELAKINRTSINIQEFQTKVVEMEEFHKLNRGLNALSEEESFMIRDHVWNQMVNQVLLSEIYEKAGIVVTPEELMDMVAGNNIHPFIRQHPLFTDQQTGAFSQQQVMNFLMAKNQDPTARFYWMMLEEQLLNERLVTKYMNLFEKGMFIPNTIAETEMASRDNVVDFNFVTARFTSVNDSEVSVSSDEINKFYRANQDRFKQEATRDIEYVTFDVVPTANDSLAAREWLENMMVDFSNPAIDPVQFVNLNSDLPFTGANQSASEFSIAVERFVTTGRVNDVYGPFFEDGRYKAARLVAINMLPDSVRARHILLRGDTPEAAQLLADSLMAVLRAGGNFADLARRYSQDPGSAVNGGDLGWFGEGMMVQEFNDAAFQGEAGDVVKVQTQFGVHVLNITQRGTLAPKYQVAILARNITYSPETFQAIFSQASRFASTNNSPDKFNAAIEQDNLLKRFGRGLGENDREVQPLEDSRELVRWAFESNVGTISPVFEFGDQFVIAHLLSATEEGVMPLELAREQIERELINEKKGELLVTRFKDAIASSSDINVIASKMNSQVQTAQGISFTSFQVPGAGIEPALVSLAVHSPVNSISQPVAGINGVYVLQVTNSTDIQVEAANIAAGLRQEVTRKTQQQFLQSIRENAEIVDRRARFY